MPDILEAERFGRPRRRRHDRLRRRQPKLHVPLNLVVVSCAERVPGTDAGIGAEHDAGAGVDHRHEIVLEHFFARGRIRIRGAGLRMNVGDDLRRQRLFEERIVVADVAAIAERDDGRPVRLLLPDERASSSSIFAFWTMCTSTSIPARNPSF